MRKADIEPNSNPTPKSTSIIPLSFDGAPIRIETIDGALWFVAKDVASILGYADAPSAIRDHCRKQTSVGKVGVSPTLSVFNGLHPQTILINEGDVNRLISRSKLPAAERFQDWLFDEVVPSIRKTGGYGVPAIPSLQSLLSDPDMLLQIAAHHAAARKQAETRLIESETHVAQLVGKVEEMVPTVEAFDRIAAADGSLCITDAAKSLQVQPRKLFAWLRANRWIYGRTGSTQDVSYQNRIAQGYLEHKVTIVLRNDGTEKAVTQARVTPKGLARLAKEFPQPEQSEVAA